MKKTILLITALCTYGLHAAQPIWKHNGIYVVNNTEGDLIIRWNRGEKRLNQPTNRKTSKVLIPVGNDTEVNIFYTDHIEDHNMESCKGKAHLSFTTNDKTVLYEITGGYYEGVGAFNRAAPGHHCRIKIHGRLNPKTALKKYHDLK